MAERTELDRARFAVAQALIGRLGRGLTVAGERAAIDNATEAVLDAIHGAGLSIIDLGDPLTMDQLRALRAQDNGSSPSEVDR